MFVGALEYSMGGFWDLGEVMISPMRILKMGIEASVRPWPGEENEMNFEHLFPCFNSPNQAGILRSNKALSIKLWILNFKY